MDTLFLLHRKRWNGTETPLPYTSLLEKTMTLRPCSQQASKITTARRLRREVLRNIGHGMLLEVETVPVRGRSGVRTATAPQRARRTKKPGVTN
jgi:hypothetical protein